MLDTEILGPVPSALDLRHPDAQEISRAGYHLTDFGSLFRAPSDGFLVTSPGGSLLVVRDIVVESLGPLVLSNGEMILFDPGVHSFDKTAIAVCEPLPTGEHEVWLARSGKQVLGALVVFAGDTAVHGFRPARLGTADAPLPVPPRFFMPPTRLSIGIADRASYLVTLNSALREIPWAEERALARALASGAPDEPPPGWVPKRTLVSPAVFAPLQQPQTTRPHVLNVPGLVGFTSDTPASTWLGIDIAQRVRVLAFDFAALRRWGGPMSRPGLSLARISLAMPYVLAGMDPYEAAELALAIRDLVEAYEQTDDPELGARIAQILDQR
jgi:hypothetical protein